MNDSYLQKSYNYATLDRDLKSFVQSYIETHALPIAQDEVQAMKVAWEQVSKGIPSFTTLLDTLICLNRERPSAESKPDTISLFDTIETLLMLLLKDALQPSHISSNVGDPCFAMLLKDYCMSRESKDGTTQELPWHFFDEVKCEEVRTSTSIPHLSSPFIITLIRYTYYHQLFNRLTSDADYRHSQEGEYRWQYDLSKVTKVDWGNYTQRDVCEQYLITRNGGAFTGAVFYDGFVLEKLEDIPSYIFPDLVEREGLRLGRDYSYLKKHFNRRFADALMEWHKYYFDYLVECLHSCEGYEDYQIEYLVPALQLEKVSKKQKPINERQVLISLDNSCRRTIVAKIHQCKTDADFGKLLYQLQYKWKYFTTNQSRTKYYLAMQQIGKVQFGSSGDFSNCNKGYNQARQADKKR